jgi:hypothetical protein
MSRARVLLVPRARALALVACVVLFVMVFGSDGRSTDAVQHAYFITWVVLQVLCWLDDELIDVRYGGGEHES